MLILNVERKNNLLQRLQNVVIYMLKLLLKERKAFCVTEINKMINAILNFPFRSQSLINNQYP